MLIALQQAAWAEFAAVALLCFGSGGLPQFLVPADRALLADPETRRARLPDVARRMFGGTGYADLPVRQGDDPATRALRAARAATLAPVALLAMTPGNIAAELGRIAVPTLLALGAHDMTGAPHRLVADYRRSADMTLHVVDAARHNIFATQHAPALFDRIRRWTAALALRDSRPTGADLSAEVRAAT